MAGPMTPSSSPSSRPGETRFTLAAVATALGFAIIPFLIVNAPIEPTMGIVQKIFYFHVPCAWVLLLSAFVCAGGSVAYLFKGSEGGDRLAISSAEIGVLFGACVMVTGPLWARVAWGVFWTWDARLTTSLLLWLMLIAYLLARRYGGPGAKKLCAALALFAAVDVPLVYFSVNVWRTIHPKTTVVTTLGPGMRQVFLASSLLFILFAGVLLALRLRLERARAALAELELAYEDYREDHLP
jgi:heme exporter protein C